jgi:hypothetical protein
MRLSIFLDRFGSDREFVLAALAVELFMVLFFLECKIYDLVTAAIFALSLGLLAREKFLAYFFVFVIGCLNRETMILMTAVYVLHFHGQPGWRAGAIYQLVVFVIIRIALMVHFAGAPGGAFWFRPVENIEWFMQFPWVSLVHWAALALVTWLCIRQWYRKPLLLRNAFTVLAPSLVMLYLVFGWAFEVRVFAEVYPVAFALAFGGELL